MSGLGDLPGLHITAPPSRHATPTATAVCRCGTTRHARGRDQVLALIAAYTTHHATCTDTPTTGPTTDRRTAA